MPADPCPHDEAREIAFYSRALELLRQSGCPFLIGGAYALQCKIGVRRRTKDLDVFVLPNDVPGLLEVFQKAGYRSELTFSHWLGKVFSDDCLLDIIFSSGNGICRVDRQWFDHALDGEVLGVRVKLCPPEETIWQKAYVMERDRCDLADVAHLLLHFGKVLDWPRLHHRFGSHWQLLAAQVVLFDFIYPDHRDCIPDEVRKRLFGQLDQPVQPPARPRCRGPLLSATQFVDEIEAGTFADERKVPPSDMSDEQIAAWTANFIK